MLDGRHFLYFWKNSWGNWCTIESQKVSNEIFSSHFVSFTLSMFVSLQTSNGRSSQQYSSFHIGFTSNASKTYMETWVLLQKRIQRKIAGFNRRSHTVPNDINTYLSPHASTLQWKYYSVVLIFKKHKDVHQYSIRQTNHYRVPCVETELGKSVCAIIEFLFEIKFWIMGWIQK